MTGHTHEAHGENSKTQIGSERSFGLVFGVVFALVGAWNLYAGNAELGYGALALALFFVLLAIVVPSTLKFLNLLWFKFGLMLHKIISPLVLGMLFFLTVVPTGLIMRALGKDPLRLRLEPETKSYWIHRDPPGPEPKSMSNQF